MQLRKTLAPHAPARRRPPARPPPPQQRVPAAAAMEEELAAFQATWAAISGRNHWEWEAALTGIVAVSRGGARGRARMARGRMTHGARAHSRMAQPMRAHAGAQQGSITPAARRPLAAPFTPQGLASPPPALSKHYDTTAEPHANAPRRRAAAPPGAGFERSARRHGAPRAPLWQLPVEYGLP